MGGAGRANREELRHPDRDSAGNLFAGVCKYDHCQVILGETLYAGGKT
jgi:hypothetical protein